MSLTQHFKIESVYRPGCLGRMIALQAEVYHPIFGVGQAFEISRANDMAKFFSDYKSQRDGFFLAVLNGEVVGSIVIDGREQDERGPELRWFALDPKARGYGIGKRLLHTALESCQGKGYERVHLITSPRLETALHLYQQAGFQQTLEFVDETTSTPLLAFELHFPKTLAVERPTQKQYYEETLC
jgi:ribosomal protein S18 acetylase RimI-like enzyme